MSNSLGSNSHIVTTQISKWPMAVSEAMSRPTGVPRLVTLRTFELDLGWTDEHLPLIRSGFLKSTER
jgi:hypothetical protein